MIIFDATVFVYSAGADHRYREPCRRLLTATVTRSIRATTTVEAIQEFLHVRARRGDRADAARRAGELTAGLHPLLRPTEADLELGLGLFVRHDRLGAFASVLAATALGAGADALVSADLGFAGVPGLRHVVPDDDGVAALLAAG